MRRAILSDDASETVVGFADGTVVGWLPSHLSDFISEYTGKAAPLWHIKVCAGGWMWGLPFLRASVCWDHFHLNHFDGERVVASTQKEIDPLPRPVPVRAPSWCIHSMTVKTWGKRI